LKEKHSTLKEAELSLKEAKRQHKGSKVNGRASTLQAQAYLVPLFTQQPDRVLQLTKEVEILRQEIAELNTRLQPYREIKAQFTKAQQHLRWLKGTLVQHINEAYATTTPQQCEDIVLNIAYTDLSTELNWRLLSHRQQVIATIENWWDKYRFTLEEIRTNCDEAEKKLAGLLRGLGYAK